MLTGSTTPIPERKISKNHFQQRQIEILLPPCGATPTWSTNTKWVQDTPNSLFYEVSLTYCWHPLILPSSKRHCDVFKYIFKHTTTLGKEKPRWKVCLYEECLKQMCETCSNFYHFELEENWTDALSFTF